MAAPTSKISNLLHQMWLNKETNGAGQNEMWKWNDGPPLKHSQSGYQEISKQNNPDLGYMFWNMGKMEDLFQKNKNELGKYYLFWKSGLRFHIEKCDFARYLVLYVYGGVYMDLDFIAIKNLSRLFKIQPPFGINAAPPNGSDFNSQKINGSQEMEINRTLLLVLEPKEHSPSTDPLDIPKRVFNGFLGSSPKNPFWLDFMDEIMKNYRMRTSKSTSSVFGTTGPLALSKFCYRHPKWSNLLFTPTASAPAAASTTFGSHVKTPSSLVFVDTCLLMPFSWENQHGQILAQECSANNNNQFKLQDTYAYTVWKEGSDWQSQSQPNTIASIEAASNKILPITAIAGSTLILAAALGVGLYFLIMNSKKKS